MTLAITTIIQSTYSENNVTVSLIKLSLEGFVHLHGHKVLDLPDCDPRYLPHILQEELRVVQLRFLQVLVPALYFQVRVFQVTILLQEDQDLFFYCSR